MDVLTLYVGQGALAIARNEGEAIFIDSLLPVSDEDLKERIERQIASMMRGMQAAGLILTGFDADHCCPEGVDHILGVYKPAWVMYPTYYKETKCASDVFGLIDYHVKRRKAAGSELRRVSVRVDKLSGFALAGLAQKFNFELFSPHIEDMDHSNNSSIVLKLTGLGERGFSYLITGDTESGRWERIADLFGSRLKASVLDAAHHGSRNGAHPKSLLLVEPHTVLISAGVDNQYGHPDPQAVRAYAKVAKQVWATNVEGGVSLLTRAKGLEFETLLVR